MREKETPFFINQGIFLEKENLLLKWWVSRKELITLGNPKIIKGNDEYSALVWENRSFFNGKILNASVEFNQLNPNDILERIRFNIPNQLPWDSYYEYLNLFKDLFGKPQDCSMFSHSGSPLDKWIVCDVEIAIGIDQMWDDCLIFNIYKTKA